MRRPRFRQLHLAAALASAALLVGVNVGTAVHTAVVKHVLCAEHGEVIHADAPNERNDKGGEPGHHEGHEHDHCRLLAAAWDAVSVIDPPALAMPTTPAQRTPSADAPSHPPTALLRSAPKTSPPRA